MIFFCENDFEYVLNIGVIGKKHGFDERANRMNQRGMINDKVKDDLHWLWNKRKGIHIYELDFVEYESYDMKDYKRALRITNELRDSLEAYSS